MFDERKIAQMAAYLLSKDEGRYAKLKLMKLLYLVDRESMDKYGFPMSGDNAYSLKMGPVLSNTLDLMNGCSIDQESGWDSWIVDDANYEMSVKKTIDNRDSLDELTDSDIKILDSIWQQFGGMDQWQLVDYTHDKNNCPEWIDPKGSSNPISKARILLGLGKSKEEAIEDLSDIKSEESINKLLHSI